MGGYGQTSTARSTAVPWTTVCTWPTPNCRPPNGPSLRPHSCAARVLVVEHGLEVKQELLATRLPTSAAAGGWSAASRTCRICAHAPALRLSRSAAPRPPSAFRTSMASTARLVSAMWLRLSAVALQILRWVGRRLGVPRRQTRRERWAGHLSLTAWIREFPAILYGLTVFLLIFILTLMLSWEPLGRLELEALARVEIVFLGALSLVVLIWGRRIGQHAVNAKRQEIGQMEYHRALSMLAHDRVALRLAAIQALERIAEERSDDYHIDVVFVLCSFIRHPAANMPASSRLGGDQRMAEDAEAALAAVMRLESRQVNASQRERQVLDLRGADLATADLTSADFSGALLQRVSFSGALFSQSTKLDGADISHARFCESDGSRPAIGLTTENLEGAVWDPTQPPHLP